MPTTIIDVGNNTYKYTYAAGDAIEVGDKTSLDFKPNIKIGKWDNECEIQLELVEAVSASSVAPTVVGEVITYEVSKILLEIKPTSSKTGFNQTGGIDLTITLKSKPANNYLTFTYNAKNVAAWLQPELTTEEIVQHCHRPVHVINSIAFYNFNRLGKMNNKKESKYLCGKVGHLYRMQATDMLGKKAYADWTTSSNTLLLVLLVDFWNTAVYPVVIRPLGDTFGYNVAGGSAMQPWDNVIADTFTYSPTGAATIDDINWYSINCGSDEDCHGKCGIYNGTDLIANGESSSELEATLVEVEAWITCTFGAAPVVSAAISYTLAINGDGGSNFNGPLVAYDLAGATPYKHDAEAYANPLPDPAAWVSYADIAGNRRKYSIYVNYTLTGGSPARSSVSNTMVSNNLI